MRTSFITAVFIFVLSAGLISCTESESHEPIVTAAVGLDVVWKNWLKEGRPAKFDPNTAVRSTDLNFFQFTNQISAAGDTYKCVFGVRSDLISSPGVMAITDNGTILWIYDKSGKVIVSPEKNGIQIN